MINAPILPPLPMKWPGKSQKMPKRQPVNTPALWRERTFDTWVKWRNLKLLDIVRAPIVTDLTPAPTVDP